MRIAFIEIEGFRGIRAHLRINLPSGFLVVTGRNGSGKSTVCDALEYALTGTISKYDDGMEGGESTAQYIWWRGQRPANSNFVRVGILDDEQQVITITRRPDGLEVSGRDDVGAALCDVAVVPREPLRQLCRTAIIRDESIAALSIDMPEVDRFAFVRAALGTDALDEIAQKHKPILQMAKKRCEATSNAYARCREQLTSLLSQTAEARAKISAMPDVAAAEATVRNALADQSSDSERLIASARQKLAAWRRASDTLTRLAGEVTSVRQELEIANSPENTRAIKEWEEEIEAIQIELAEHENERSRIQALLAQISEGAPMRTRLASLFEAGRGLGLRDGRCPLCKSEVRLAEFQTAVAELGAELADAERVGASLRAKYAQDASREEVLRVRLSTLEQKARALRARPRELQLALERIALEAGGKTSAEQISADELMQRAANGEERIAALAHAVDVLEASAALDRVAELERQVTLMRQEAERLENEWHRAEAAEAKAKRLLVGIRRTLGEIVEDRLAALDPLLKDLYGRLKPHADWSELNYKVRGEVRKYLSLRVGDDVNPRFTFSSGQRRAIGLAFLLAVHLSRPWCRLRTLILDDPIQHIDDFRALHLVEVLSAIHRSGQQVICAVEDEALAELMCRRIRDGTDGDGLLVRMAYRAGDGAGLESALPVRAAVRHVLLAG